MNLEIQFEIDYIRNCLKTTPDLFSPEIDKNLCSIPIIVKGEEIEMVMLKSKVETAYNKALSEGSDKVELTLESLTEKDIEDTGFKIEGNYLVPDN